MTRLGWSLMLVLFLVPSAGASAQDASIAGVITADDAAATPIARATVTLSGAALRPSLVAFTDSAGRYTFSGLPAGSYTLTAKKATFLPIAYGQTTAGRGSGLLVSLGTGQRLTLSWKLPRGAAITGRILDDRGQPMRDVPIVLMHYRTVDGERRLLPVACCVWPETDGQGLFRVADLLPGDYLVAALPPGQYVYMPEPFVAGGAENRQIGTEELQWALKELSGPTGAPEPPRGHAVTYSRMFYPGTPDPARATTISVDVGEERPGLDFAMRLERAARVEGRVVGPDGQPVERPTVAMSGSSTQVPGSTFVRRGLTPGRYTITALGARNTLWGSLDVDINGEDILGLELKLAPSASISGRVVFESTSLTPPVASTVRVSIRPPAVLLNVNAAADGSFTLSGPAPGPYRLHAVVQPPAPTGVTATPAPAGWVLKSAMLDGRDLADVPIDIAAGQQISGVVLTFTDRVTELSGTLFDASGQPAPGYYVVVFSTEASFWSAGSRRTPAPVRAGTDGRYRFSSLPPGTYHVAALTSIDQIDLTDTAMLRTIAAAAITITLGDGEKKTQDLKFGG